MAAADAGSMKPRIIARALLVLVVMLESGSCQVYGTTSASSFEEGMGMKTVISKYLPLPLSDSSHLPSPTTTPVLLRTSSSAVLARSSSPTSTTSSSSPVLPSPSTSMLTSSPSPTKSTVVPSSTSPVLARSPSSAVVARSPSSAVVARSPSSAVVASSSIPTTSLSTSSPSPTSSSSPSPTTSSVVASSPSPTLPSHPNTSVLTRPSTSLHSESPSYSATSVLIKSSSTIAVSIPKPMATSTTSAVVGQTTRGTGLFSSTPYPTASVVPEQQCAMELEELQYLRGWVYGLAFIAFLFLVLSLVLAICLAVVICKRRGHYTVRHEASSEVNKYWTSPGAAETDELEMKYKPPTKIENQNVLDVMVLNDETDLTDLQTFQKPKVSVTEQPDPDALKTSPPLVSPQPQGSVFQGEAAQQNSKPPRPAVRPKPLRKKQLDQRNSDPYALPGPQPVGVPSPQNTADPRSYTMLDPSTMQSQKYTPLVKRGESLPIMRNVRPVVVPKQKS